MSKVICIRTKQEITDMPFGKEQAEKLIAHIMKFKAPESTADSFCFMYENVIRYVINNSGADMKLVQELSNKNKKKVKQA